jgi:hypothetical protein
MGEAKWLKSVLFACALLAFMTTRALAVAWSDSFDSYIAGRGLGGQDGWTGSTTGAIDVVSWPYYSFPNSVRVTGGLTSVDAMNDIPDEAGVGGIVAAGFKIQGSLSTPGDTTWFVEFLDPTGNSLARFYGTGGSVRGRIDGTANVTGVINLGGLGTWDDLKVVIDTVANTSSFYFNGVLMGAALPHSPAGDVVGSVKIERIGNVNNPTDRVYLDDIYVPEPTTLALLGLGGLLLRPRA